MKILVVEDEPAIQNLIKIFLEKGGYEVHTARGVAEALQRYSATRPDLVLLDIGLMDGEGYAVCRNIRLERKDGVPVLFMTTRGDVRSRLEAFRCGAQDYIQKPVTAEELLARVGIHLQSRKALEDLAKKNSDLELRERVRRDMTDMIVHDLKAPLCSIQATLDLIKMKGLITEEQNRWMIESSENATGTMLIMINDILDLAKAENGELRPDFAPVDLAALLEKAKSFFEPTCRRFELQLQTRLGKGDFEPNTDQELVFRVLANLVSNAIKFSPKGGEILIEAARDKGALRLSVQDRGPGVPDKDKQRIFDKFVQLSMERNALDRGSGIGLAFCRFAAEALGGRIWIEDRKGGGSCFVLELPDAACPTAA